MMDGPPGLATAPPPVSEALLERHVREMLREAEVIAVEELAGGTVIGCIDGRRSGCVAGTPGGKAGLLVLTLASWEQGTSTALAPDEVDHLFDRYLQRFGTFHFHSDRTAQDRLARYLAGAGVDAGNIDALVLDPPPAVRAAVLEAMLRPEHLGCGHLRLMLEYPGAYRVRRDLLEAVLAAYFRRLWDGDPRLVFEILNGDHDEQGVVRVRATSRRARGDASVVTMCPTHGSLQLFVHHPDAMEWLQHRHAEFLAREGLIPPGAVHQQTDSQRELGEQHMRETLRRIAAGLPFFDVVVDVDPERDTAAVRVARVEDAVDMDPAAFVRAAGRDAQLLDVRTAMEFRQGHLAGARNIDMMRPDFTEAVDALGLDLRQPLYLYCRSGNRSGHAARLLRERGYDRAFNVGGFEDLIREGAAPAS
jgi:rhodanese-related sulfurtransferase